MLNSEMDHEISHPQCVSKQDTCGKGFRKAAVKYRNVGGGKKLGSSFNSYDSIF